MDSKHPGARWRVLAHDESGHVELENRGIFDELVVDDWLHIEQLDDNSWWFRVGDVRMFAQVTSTGLVDVDIERGAHGEVRGTTKSGV